MSKILIAAEIPTASKETRDQFISYLTAASKYSADKEPGVSKYCICTDPTNETIAWAIEEYADKKTLDEHMESPPVKSMLQFMSSNPIVEGVPKIRCLSWIEDMSFTKPEVDRKTNLFVVFADVEFETGKRDDTLKYWRNNLESSREEAGCFSYGFAQDPEKPDHLYTLEVYESESYFTDIHFQTAAVQDTIEKTKGERKGLTLSKLQYHAGFFSR